MSKIPRTNRQALTFGQIALAFNCEWRVPSSSVLVAMFPGLQGLGVPGAPGTPGLSSFTVPGHLPSVLIHNSLPNTLPVGYFAPPFVAPQPVGTHVAAPVVVAPTPHSSEFNRKLSILSTALGGTAALRNRLDVLLYYYKALALLSPNPSWSSIAARLQPAAAAAAATAQPSPSQNVVALSVSAAAPPAGIAAPGANALPTKQPSAGANCTLPEHAAAAGAVQGIISEAKSVHDDKAKSRAPPAPVKETACSSSPRKERRYSRSRSPRTEHRYSRSRSPRRERRRSRSRSRNRRWHSPRRSQRSSSADRRCSPQRQRSPVPVRSTDRRRGPQRRGSPVRDLKVPGSSEGVRWHAATWTTVVP